MYLCMRWEHITIKRKGAVRHTGKEVQCGWVLGSSQEAGVQGAENGLKQRDEEEEAGPRISEIIYHGAPRRVVHHADSSIYITLNSDTKPLSPTHRHTESLSQNRA